MRNLKILGAVALVTAAIAPSAANAQRWHHGWHDGVAMIAIGSVGAVPVGMVTAGRTMDGIAGIRVGIGIAAGGWMRAVFPSGFVTDRPHGDLQVATFVANRRGPR